MPGNNRDWGYASGDVDDLDNDKLTYTSYEDNGMVNKYSDNGDGGHSHENWSNKDDYNLGNDPDGNCRSESGSTDNPSTGEVQDKGGCYLTTACMLHMANDFNDSCDELMTLRWFRDKFVSEDDIKHYYATAPIIVDAINKAIDNKAIYNFIYQYVVQPCVNAIKNKQYEFAYKRYKDSILKLEEKYARKELEQKLTLVLKK